MSPLVQLSPTRIYKARLKAGLTQEDLAHRLRDRGLKASARQVHRWEHGPDRGGNTPLANVVPFLADALGISIDELFAEPGTDEDDEEAAPLLTADLLEALAPLAALLRNAGVR